MRHWGHYIIAVAAVVAAMNGAQAEPNSAQHSIITGDALLAKGHALLQANCARCHAIGTDDTSPHKEALPFRVVVTRYPPDNLAEALAEGLISGHPDMPEFVFEPDEVGAITAYLASLKPQNK